MATSYYMSILYLGHSLLYQLKSLKNKGREKQPSMNRHSQQWCGVMSRYVKISHAINEGDNQI